MTKGMLFWILMFIWLIFGFFVHWDTVSDGHYGLVAGNLMLFFIIGLLGWKVFGSPVQD